MGADKDSISSTKLLFPDPLLPIKTVSGVNFTVLLSSMALKLSTRKPFRKVLALI